MSEAINIGSLVADLDVNTSKLDKGVANAESALNALRSQIIALAQAFKRGEVGPAEYADRLAYLTEAQNQLVGAMNAGAAAAARAGAAGAAAAKQTQQQWNAAGRSLMQFGYMVDDIQYGFGAIVNNLGPFGSTIATTFGASATQANAFGAALQIGGVAAFQLYTHWSQLMDAMGVGIPNAALDGLEQLQKELKKTAKVVDDLEAKPRLTVAEKDQLTQARAKEKTLKEEIKTRAAVERTTEGPSREERERGSAFDEAVRQSGGKAALKELEDALKDRAESEGITISPAEAKRNARAKGIELTDAQAKDLASKKFLQGDNGELATPEKMARDLFAKAAGGDKGARDQIQEEVDRVAGEFGSDFSHAIDREAPETQEAHKRFGELSKADEDRNKEAERTAQQEFDADNQIAEDKINELKRSIQERKQKHQAENKKAREILPGAEAIAGDAVLGGAASGNPQAVEDAKQQIREAPKANGMKEGAAGRATDDIFAEAGKDAQQKVVERMLKGPEGAEGEKASKSETFSAADLANRVQGGVGDKSDGKKTADNTKKIVDLLAEQARAQGKGPLQFTIGQ